MNITGVVVLDLSDLVDIDTLNTSTKRAYARWDAIAMHHPSRVIVNIGSAAYVMWNPQLVQALSLVQDVQIVGTWPEHVDLAVANLRAAAARAAA